MVCLHFIANPSTNLFEDENLPWFINDDDELEFKYADKTWSFPLSQPISVIEGFVVKRDEKVRGESTPIGTAFKKDRTTFSFSFSKQGFISYPFFLSFPFISFHFISFLSFHFLLHSSFQNCKFFSDIYNAYLSHSI